MEEAQISVFLEMWLKQILRCKQRLQSVSNNKICNIRHTAAAAEAVVVDEVDF